MILRGLAWLAAVLLGLLLSLGAVLYLLDDDDYRHVLIWSTDFFLDSQLEIEGAFSIKFAHEVELSAEKVRLQANDGSYELALGDIYLQQRFMSYLRSGTFWINELSIAYLRAGITATQSTEELDWHKVPIPPVVIEKTQIDRLAMVYTTGSQQHELDLRNIVIDDGNNQGPIKVSAAGTVNSKPLTFAGTLGSLAQLRGSRQSFPIAFSLHDIAGKQEQSIIEFDGTVNRTRPGYSELEATFDVDLSGLLPLVDQRLSPDRMGRLKGSLKVANARQDWEIKSINLAAADTDLYRLKIDGELVQSNQLALRSEFEVPDPAALGAQFGVELRGHAAYKGKGQLSGNWRTVSYRGKASVGRVESDLALTVSLRGNRPTIQGKWDLRDLYLADIGIDRRLADIVEPSITPAPDGSETAKSARPKPEVPPSTATAAKPTDLDRELLDLSALQKFNLDLEVSIDNLVGADYAVTRLSGSFKLSDGLLSVAPMRIIHGTGATDLELTMAARATPDVGLRLKTENLLLEELLEQLRPELQAKGKLGLQADVKSAGTSGRELLSALKGDIGVSLEEANLPRQYLEIFMLDGPASPGPDDAFTSVEIDGTVAVKFEDDVRLSAEAIHLKANDGSYEVTLGKLNLIQNLAAYLETGRLWIHNLSLIDTHAEIVKKTGTASQTAPGPAAPREYEWHEFDWQGYDFSALVIEKMRLGRLSLDYTTDDKRHMARLSHFEIDNDDSSEPMKVSAAGTINARDLRLEASVGAPAQPRGENRTYPIDFRLSDGAAGAAPDRPVIQLDGSIGRTAAGSSKTEAKFKIDLTELATIINQGVVAEGLGQLQGDVNFAEVNGRWGIRKLQLAATDTNLYRLSVDGEIDNANTLELRSKSAIPDPAAFGAQFGIDLTGFAPYDGEGLLSGTRNKLSYRGIVNIGRIRNETAFTVTLVGGKPLIKGKTTIAELYLPDIGLDLRMGADPDARVEADPGNGAQSEPEPEPEKPAASPADNQPVFSRESLNLTSLRQLNLDLEILIDQISGTDFLIDQFSSRIVLTDGVLRVAPTQLIFEGGKTDIDLGIDARADPSVTLKVAAENMVLGELISQVQNEVPVEGNAHVDIDVVSTGHSAHELAADLKGDVGFGLENARLPKKYLDFLSANLFGWMFRMITFENAYTNVDCLIVDFDVNQGVAKSNFLAADGPSVRITGEASLDLRQETIDMLLVPKQKHGLVANISSARIKGPLQNPEVRTSAGEAAAVAIGGVMVIPEITIPLGLIDVLWKKLFSSDSVGSGCSELIEEHKAE